VSKIKENIEIFLWDEATFFSSKEDWDDLLEKSSADALFMSWAWMSSWWNAFSNDAMGLKIVVAKERDSKRLIAIAPLYLTDVRIKNAINVKRLQFIGNCWHGKSTMRTELLEVIVDNEFVDQLWPVLWNFFETKIKWDEFICQDMPIESSSYEYLVKSAQLPKNNYLLRNVAQYKNYFLNLHDDFSTYLGRLGSGTRKRLYNRRKVLDSANIIHFHEVNDLDWDKDFDSLNYLHRLRWNKPAFSEETLLFNKMLAQTIEGGRAVRFSYILCNEDVISIQYNYLINDRKYNIQAGFNPELFKKVSLGYLHFGYEIEQCYQNNLKRYYFLAGKGKNINYKEELTNDSLDIVDFIIIKKPSLKALYYLYDKANQYFNVIKSSLSFNVFYTYFLTLFSRS
jgi:hypothetical protein